MESSNTAGTWEVWGTMYVNSLSGGVGAKYILSNGFGIRGIVDYYSSNESYVIDEVTDTRILSGPRIQFGLSYRFKKNT